MPLRMDGHGHEGDGDLFAGGEELVELALGGIFADLFGQIEQFVGGLAHGGDDGDDLVALFLGGDDALGGEMDFGRVGYRGAAEFLDDQSHAASLRSKTGDYSGGLVSW